jgi:delta(3,5)-delta(2,4)-dienoyl-CoA isomerase
MESESYYINKMADQLCLCRNLLNYSRDHSVAEGLEYTVTWNAAMLNTEDIPRSVEAFVTKKPAVYSKL